jgi:hypothetical protein
MFLLYPLMTIASILFYVLTMILAPLLALTADAGGNLPVFLRWFQTFDASLDEGAKYGYTGSKWWIRTHWIWRNPGYTFDMNVLGIDWVPEEWLTVYAKNGVFFAYNSTNWAFNFEYGRIKLGWKAQNHYDWPTGTWVPGNWAAFPKIPICFM